MRRSIFTTTACTLVAAVALALSAAGCETVKDNPRATGTVAGAGAGALAGSAIAGKGAKTEGAAIGAAVGAAGGWLAGDQIDKNSDNDDHKRTRHADDRYYDRY